MLGEGDGPGQRASPVTIDVDVDQDFLGCRSPVGREVKRLPFGKVIGHVGVLQPRQSTSPPAHAEALEVELDVIVFVAVGGVAGLGLDAEAVGGGPLSNPSADILGFLGSFSWL